MAIPQRAIVRFAGREYLVSEGDVVRAVGRAGVRGETVEAEAPLVFAAGAAEGAPGKATIRILDVRRGRKVYAMRFKRRKGVRKVRGARPYVTSVRIESILAEDSSDRSHST